MAAITGAVISAGVGIASIRSDKKSAEKARRSQQEASRASLAEQRSQAEQARADLAGSRERGEEAGVELQALLGLTGAEAEQDALRRFTLSPGQKFLEDRILRGVTRGAAATGELGGGNVLTALQEQAFNIASTQLGERKSRLSDVAAIGSGATRAGVQAGARSSENISNIFAQRGVDEARNIRLANESRQSGLRRIGGAFTGSGGILSSIPARTGSTSAAGAASAASGIF